MWCLAYFFPLTIGDIIPLDDHHREHFLTFLVIVDYVLSPSTTAEKMAFVSVLVGDFLTEFVEWYKSRCVPRYTGFAAILEQMVELS